MVQSLHVDVARMPMLQIVLGLGGMHDKGAYHLDLKPMNILIDDLGCPLVGDFDTSSSHRACLLTRKFFPLQAAAKCWPSPPLKYPFNETAEPLFQ